jgi:PAS domain S-box-containing protein
MTRVKIGQKLLLLLLAVSLGPLLVVGVILVINAQKELRKEAINQQQLAAKAAAADVDNFLGSKINSLIFQSQTSAARQFDIPNESLNLAAMIKQDRDIERISLVDKQGMEKIAVNRSGLVADHKNVSTDDAFKATTFLAGKEYIGPVKFVDDVPHVTIAVPLIRFTGQQDLTHLSTADFGKYRSPDDILGVIISDINLSDLWTSVLSAKVGDKGYTYVVDDKGNLIAHPDRTFLAQNHNLSHVHEIEDFLGNNADVHTSTSERGVPVLASYEAITRTNWGVITEEPTSSVFASVNAFYRLGGVILLVVAIIAVACSLLFRKQLLVPIQMIAAGALRIGRGDLRFKIPVKSDDELGDLAHSFNDMGGSLQALVNGLQEKNRSLSVEQSKLSNILQSISDGVIAIDESQRIISINEPAAKLLDKKPEELTGQGLLRSFTLMRDDQPFVPHIDKPGVYHFEDVLLPQGGKLAYLDLVVVVLEEKADQISAILTIHDMTQGRELETMKLDFVAIAAHELRTPLTVVRGYLDLINTSPDFSKLTVMNIEYLERALSGVAQLSSLINNILNVSRIERGTLNIARSKVDLASLLNQLIKEEHVGAILKQQHLRYEGPISGIYVSADESAISEVISNLIINATKYTQEKGTITVDLIKNGNFVRVEVKDNGPGIPDSAKPHMFTKFFRVGSSMTNGNRGTGLGLFISKNIVELHHGQIGMASEVGKGSTFFFTLPAIADQSRPKVNAHTEELKGVHGWFPKRPNR